MKTPPRQRRLLSFALLSAVLLCASACVSRPAGKLPDSFTYQVEERRIRVGDTTVSVDLYLPEGAASAPVMVVAHGFSRSRRNMAGWGRFLAERGVIALVPDLPHWSNHPANGVFLRDLLRSLENPTENLPFPDSPRVGLMGFSAGGLSSLLAASELRELTLWIGLDPVDRNGLGERAAAKVACPAWILLADPSSCNAQGNGRAIARALPGVRMIPVAGAVHVDAEMPTSPLAERVCGSSTPEKRAEFQEQVRRALHSVGWVPTAEAKAGAAELRP